LETSREKEKVVVAQDQAMTTNSFKKIWRKKLTTDAGYVNNMKNY
jgi:hypothetical protein